MRRRYRFALFLGSARIAVPREQCYVDSKDLRSALGLVAYVAATLVRDISPRPIPAEMIARELRFQVEGDEGLYSIAQGEKVSKGETTVTGMGIYEK